MVPLCRGTSCRGAGEDGRGFHEMKPSAISSIPATGAESCRDELRVMLVPMLHRDCWNRWSTGMPSHLAVNGGVVCTTVTAVVG